MKIGTTVGNDIVNDVLNTFQFLPQMVMPLYIFILVKRKLSKMIFEKYFESSNIKIRLLLKVQTYREMKPNSQSGLQNSMFYPSCNEISQLSPFIKKEN